MIALVPVVELPTAQKASAFEMSSWIKEMLRSSAEAAFELHFCHRAQQP